MEHTDPTADTSAETAAQPDKETEASVASLPSAQKPGLLYLLFSPQTRVGRILRPVLRWSAFTVALLAVGLLSGYLLLYQPTSKQLDAANARVQTLEEQLGSSQQALDEAGKKSAAMQKSLDAAQADVARYATLYHLNTARQAVISKNGDAARTALKSAQTSLNTLTPLLKGQDSETVSLLGKRLELAVSELNREPGMAAKDMEILIADLLKLEITAP
jgi:multidrug resistance efflux pump